VANEQPPNSSWSARLQSGSEPALTGHEYETLEHVDQEDVDSDDERVFDNIPNSYGDETSVVTSSDMLPTVNGVQGGCLTCNVAVFLSDVVALVDVHEVSLSIAHMDLATYAASHVEIFGAHVSVMHHRVVTFNRCPCRSPSVVSLA
jgi:hypothetical protein